MDRLKELNNRMPAIYFTLIIVVLLNVYLNPNLLSFRGFNNLILQILPTVLVVMAQTCVLLVRELDISVGGMVSFSSVMMAVFMASMGFYAIPFVLLITVLIGGLTGLLVAYLRIPGVVITLATSMMLSGMALIILPSPGGFIEPSLSHLIIGSKFLLPNSLLLLFVVLLLWKYLKLSPLGHSIYATGGNAYSTFASGININRAKVAAFMLSAVFCTLAGFVLIAKTMTGDASIGTSYTLTSIAGAVLGGASFLGGVGTMRGAIAGAAVIGILVNILFFLGVSSFYQYVVSGLILLIAVTLGLAKERMK